jgi:hypothetical protein
MKQSSVKLTSAVLLAAFSVTMTGCATNSVNANYAAQIEAYASVERAKVEALKEQARAEESRFVALQRIAETGDPNTRSLAVMALAMGGRMAPAMAVTSAPVPMPPESDSDRAYKWAALFAGPITNIAAGYFGYRLGTTQSNNNADTTIASYNAFTSIAQSGVTGISALGIAGFNSNAQLGGYIQAPQPNMTIGGNGVIGSGTYNTNTDSFNTTRTCTGGVAGNAGSGASGFGGTGTTAPIGGGTGGFGGNGGAGGGANC